MTDCQQRLLHARNALHKALREDVVSASTDASMRELANEFAGLKEFFPSASLADNHRLPNTHANAVNTLETTLHMYRNCVYLLDVHRAIQSLRTAVRGLCQLVTPEASTGLFPQLHRSDGPVDSDGFDVTSKSNTFHDEDEDGSGDVDGHLRVIDEQPRPLIDESTYCLKTTAVVSALAEVERLLNEPTKFNKDNTVVFQSFLKRLALTKLKLNEHIDMLWSRWLVWKTCTTGRTTYESERHMSTTTTTAASVTEGMIMASLTIYANPELLRQLFRLIAGKGDSSGRFSQLNQRLWDHLFAPWLDKASCKNQNEFDWPTFRIDYFDGTTCKSDEADEEIDPASSSPPFTPAWRIELVQSTTPSNHTDTLILDSCNQLTNAFQCLHTNLFSLRPSTESRPSGGGLFASSDPTSLLNTCLAKRLIQGRFTSVLPSATECRSAQFLIPVTQTVYSMAAVAKDCGFFTGELDADCPFHDTDTGGVIELLRWIQSLSELTAHRRSIELLERVRCIMLDESTFQQTRLAIGGGSSGGCTSGSSGDGSGRASQMRRDKPYRTDDDDDDDNVSGEDEEMQVCRKAEADRSRQNRVLVVPTLDRLLESRANQEDLARFIDLGHFHFPPCKVSQSVITLMDLVKSITDEAKSHLSESQSSTSASTVEAPVGPNGEAMVATTPGPSVSSLKQIAAMIELVPRIIMSYTSVVPCGHAVKLKTDLHAAALYHNNCMFLAHECLTLSETHLYPLIEKVSPADESANTDLEMLDRLSAVSTAILVPHLRTSGTQVLLRHLRSQRDGLVEPIRALHKFRDLSAPEAHRRYQDVVHACWDGLRAISCGLKPLPVAVYHRHLGVLCNLVCSELIILVLSIHDLTSTDCEFLAELLQETTSEIEGYFSTCPDPDLRPRGDHDSQNSKQSTSELIGRRVPELARLRGLYSVLSAPSMAVIDQVLWRGGQGALATEARFRAAELRGLIKAIYSESTLRDQLMSRLN